MYVASGTRLFGVDPLSGAERRHVDLPKDVGSDIVLIGGDGTFYVAGGAGGSHDVVAAIGSELSVRWTFTTQNDIPRIALGQDGRVYVATDAGDVSAVTNGAAAWTSSLGVGASDLAIGDDGTVYVSTTDGRLTASSAAGAKVWSSAPPGIQASTSSSIAIGTGGTVYLSFGGALTAFDSKGAVKWNFRAEGVADTPGAYCVKPVVAGDGAIYLACANSAGADTIVAVGSDGREKVAFTTPPDVAIGRPALGFGGVLYVAGSPLFAVGP